MSEMQVEFFVMVGSRLVHESEAPALSEVPSKGLDGVDGAILFKIGDQVVLDERYWDRLDHSLLALNRALGELNSTDESMAVLPDTKLEIQFRATPAEEVELEYRTYTCDIEQAREAFQKCGERFIDWMNGNNLQTTAYEELESALRGGTT